MLWCVVSDIHGNSVALEAVFKDLRQYKISGIIGLGDYVGECGESERVLDLLIENNALLVKGNREEAMTKLWKGETPEIENSLQFQCGNMAAKQVKSKYYNMILQLPLSLSLKMGLCNALCMHGTPDNISGLVYPEEVQHMDYILENIQEDMFVNGHTHMSWQRSMHQKLGFNPGSVGLQHDGFPGQASYAVLEILEKNFKVEIMKTNFDVNQLENNMRKSGWMDEGGIIAKLALDEVKTGHKHILRFVQHAYNFYERITGNRKVVVPDDVWEAAVKTWVSGK